MPPKDRTTARTLCHEHLARGDALGWFERLYAQAEGDAGIIPWGDLVPNPHLVAWHAQTGLRLEGLRCLTVGCGLGDDCEYLARHGGRVTGFDISPTAIDWCRNRFPRTAVDYRAQDLFVAPSDWDAAFDFVLESYTLQVLPAALRPSAIRRIAGFVAPAGRLLVIARAKLPGSPEGTAPWPLLRGEFDTFLESGLRLATFEEFLDDETPSVRRFRALYAQV